VVTCIIVTFMMCFRTSAGHLCHLSCVGVSSISVKYLSLSLEVACEATSHIAEVRFPKACSSDPTQALVAHAGCSE
jgi:hypothetical protein